MGSRTAGPYNCVMAMLRECEHPECTLRTFGRLCIEHERPRERAAALRRQARSSRAEAETPRAGTRASVMVPR